MGSIIDILVINRTETDAERAAEVAKRIAKGIASPDELQEYLGDLKGAYNFADLNRVGAALQYLSARFRAYGYSSAVTARTDWAMTDTPLQGQMEAYLGDVGHLRGLVAMLETTPEAPESMEVLTWAKANDIEKILVDIEETLNRMRDGWFYSGEVFSGEV